MTPTNIHECWISWLLAALKGWRNISVELLNAGLEGADTKQWRWKPGLPQLLILLRGSLGVLSESQPLAGHRTACMLPSHWCILPWGKPFSVGHFFATVEISVIKLNAPFWKGRVMRNKQIFPVRVHSLISFVHTHVLTSPHRLARLHCVWYGGQGTLPLKSSVCFLTDDGKLILGATYTPNNTNSGRVSCLASSPFRQNSPSFIFYFNWDYFMALVQCIFVILSLGQSVSSLLSGRLNAIRVL